jgi:hypothetical protein
MNTDNKKYYNRVYVCQQKIGCIECKLFESMIDAQKSTTLYKNEQKGHCNYVFPLYNSIATIFPICKYTPIMLDKYILKYKILRLCVVKINKN